MDRFIVYSVGVCCCTARISSLTVFCDLKESSDCSEFKVSTFSQNRSHLL